MTRAEILDAGLAELEARAEVLRPLVDIAEAAAIAADEAGDSAVWERAEAEFNRLGDELLLVTRRIGEEEDDRETSERRAEYWGSVI